jgi:DNA helicase-4
LALVANARGAKPRLSPLAEDEHSLQRFVRSCIEKGLSDRTASKAIVEFLAYFRFPEPDPIPVEGRHEANRWAEGNDVRSLTGVQMRSLSETVIANWLTLNGIEWAYERKYAFHTATAEFTQYHPDFYLPDYDVYIEHWACDLNGKLPENWDADEQARYRQKMSWARQVHQEHNTRLIETYSQRNGQRTLIADLDRRLRAEGVRPAPISEEERNALISEDRQILPIVRLIKSFLALYRESNWTRQGVRARVASAKDLRAQAFLEVFEYILARYEAQLAERDEVDFSDMIREAAVVLRASRANLPLRYLLVDEFQDISTGRADLVKAILERNPLCRLFAVGDDWQSINRFAGSDIDVMVRFADHFGFTRRTDLRQTHRFGTNLLAATSRFVQKNPNQLRKDLIAARRDEYPAIEVVSGVEIMTTSRANSDSDATDDPMETDQTRADTDANSSLAVEAGRRSAREDPETQGIASLLGDVYSRVAGMRNGHEVLVLGRYNFLEEAFRAIDSSAFGIRARFSTVHKAKGAEADYVVVLDVTAGRHGFPSEIEDDPLMDLVLAGRMSFPNAEERRLFYVAMTRARYKTYLITDEQLRSSFVDELESDDYRGLVIASGAALRVPGCPVCHGGRLAHRVGPYGPFYACASYPRCRGKALKCPYCGAAGFFRKAEQFTCLFCAKVATLCPKCKEGYLKYIPAGVSARSKKPYAAFHACSTNTGDRLLDCGFRQNA